MRDLIAADKAGESVVGIVLNIVALAVMTPVAIAQRRTGRELGNDVLITQSNEPRMLAATPPQGRRAHP